MGRYIRKSTKGKWNPEQLKKAVEAVKKGGKIRASAKKYKVPESTLRRRMKANNFNSPSIGISATFTPEQERVIVEYLRNVSAWYHGLNSIQCRKIAFDTAEKLKIKHKFNRKRKIAGKDWFYGFLDRNPDFSIRKADLEGDKNKEFHKLLMDEFFNNLNEIVDKYEFSSNRIYNMQETEIYTVKINEGTDNERFKSELTWERSNKTAVTCAMNAVGSFIPPMFVFPFEDKMQLLKISVPDDSVVECNAQGCVDEEMHLIWLKHFAEITNPTRSDPVLLILNSHNGHASVEAYKFCKANNIHVLTLPAHVAFQMQPLTATVFAPLKRAYYGECHSYMMSSDSNEISVFKIADIFAKAFQKTATIDKAIRGFKLTGIWPIDPSMLDGKKFNCSSTVNNRENDRNSHSGSNDSAGHSSASNNSSDVNSTSSYSSEDMCTSESSDAPDDSDSDSDWYEKRYKTKTRARFYKKKRKNN